jgi:hypothetical protein
MGDLIHVISTFKNCVIPAQAGIQQKEKPA